MKIQPSTQQLEKYSASGYTAGGVTLTVEKGITNNTAFISFENVTISAYRFYCAGGVDL
jgi:hypothetical protein